MTFSFSFFFQGPLFRFRSMIGIKEAITFTKAAVPINVCGWFNTNWSCVVYLLVCGDMWDIIASHFMGALQNLARQMTYLLLLSVAANFFHSPLKPEFFFSLSSFVAWQFIDVFATAVMTRINSVLGEISKLNQGNVSLWKRGRDATGAESLLSPEHQGRTKGAGGQTRALQSAAWKHRYFSAWNF